MIEAIAISVCVKNQDRLHLLQTIVMMIFYSLVWLIYWSFWLSVEHLGADMLRDNALGRWTERTFIKLMQASFFTSVMDTGRKVGIFGV